MKNNIDDINGWLYHRIRMCIWKPVSYTHLDVYKRQKKDREMELIQSRNLPMERHLQRSAITEQKQVMRMVSSMRNIPVSYTHLTLINDYKNICSVVVDSKAQFIKFYIGIIFENRICRK